MYLSSNRTRNSDAFRDRLKARGYRVLISINAEQAEPLPAQPYDADVNAAAERAG